MADALQFAATKASAHSDILARLKLQPQGYLLATVHRAENTDDPSRLGNIMAALSELADTETVILPLHPKTKKILEDHSPSHRIRLLVVAYAERETRTRLISTRQASKRERRQYEEGTS
jgi:UDP-GlcNAc3NAcA epimerase